ncbi:MAG: Eco57I restriction-modification methylase domain-containing protein [Thermoleophilia bacterium]
MSTDDTTIETAREKIADLVELFRANEAAYKNPAYNETQTRREFIDPFFKALGWDVDNERGYAPAYKDVIHEDAIKVGGMTKAPDYCFRIGGQRKFFVEAKKPSVDMKNDPDPYYQLRRYAYSAKLPLSIVTDFQELAIVDCRAKPSPKDKASTGRIRYWHYEEYPDHLEELLETFSPEGIKKGGLDRMATTARSKRGTGEVDKEFLREIEAWRELLARNLALRNPGLSQRELNEAVQVTIDRIIFLRICEDRGIEEYGQLQGMQNGVNVYARLCELFQKADERYNSGLFHFREERGNPSHPDELTLDLAIDDKPLKQIVKGLYYPDSPYEFSVLPIDILGQVYEQFLGKVIRLTAGHRAIIEDKPEVKKAGGVYYTPTYIVDYIVKNTVGKLLEDSTPTKAAKLRILDPACGSGSFLIGAYEYLLDWHRDWYSENDAEKWAKGKEPRLFAGKNGWQLTTTEKKRILLNNIYGVDIDPQAVEVSKLSLLLKVLEEENQESINAQLKFFHERALPDLSRNIKCGNSLIGTDFYEGQQMGLLDEEEALRINAFDWDGPGGFSEIMKAGGFDAVIGNPPYVDIKGMPNSEVEYIFFNFPSANNRINLFAAFIEKSLQLVNKHFRFSMIIPSALATQDSYKSLRKKILENFHIRSVVRLPNESFGEVAGDVKVDTIIIVLQKQQEDTSIEIIGYAGYERITDIDSEFAHIHGEAKQKTWANSDDYVWSINRTDSEDAILRKCESKSVPLEQCVDFSLGLTPYDKYKGHSHDQIKNRVFNSNHQKDETFKKLLAGNDVRRYFISWNGEKWISYGPWLGAQREQRFFSEKRILVKQIIDWSTKQIWAGLTSEELYNTQNAFNLLPRNDWHLEYLLGIINSRLMTFYHRKKFLDEFKMRFQKILIKDCKRLPIRAINFSTPVAKTRHDQIVELVERMLQLNKQLQAANTAHEKDSLLRQIDATDRQIDRFIYELYDLTDEEIKIVEGN